MIRFSVTCTVSGRDHMSEHLNMRLVDRCDLSTICWRATAVATGTGAEIFNYPARTRLDYVSQAVLTHEHLGPCRLPQFLIQAHVSIARLYRTVSGRCWLASSRQKCRPREGG